MTESCETCMHFGCDQADSHDNNGRIDCGCDLFEQATESRFFPFHPAPGCYRINFRFTKYYAIAMAEIRGLALIGEVAKWRMASAHQDYIVAKYKGEWMRPVIRGIK